MSFRFEEGQEFLTYFGGFHCRKTLINWVTGDYRGCFDESTKAAQALAPVFNPGTNSPQYAPRAIPAPRCPISAPWLHRAGTSSHASWGWRWMFPCYCRSEESHVGKEW